jgi:hypothetical protein
MIVGWRDQQSIPDSAIAEKVPVLDAFKRGLSGRNRQTLADAWNLVAEAPASYTLDAWRDMLQNNGPLYIDTQKSTTRTGGHARVLIGMSSGGAADGSDTVMYIFDPADGQVKMSFNDFLVLYEDRTATTGGYLEYQVLHADGPLLRSSGTTAAFSLGAGAPLRGQSFRGSRSLGADDIDLNDVALIPQPDKNACWAASMAMLLSWRRKASFSPETLANEVGRSLASSYNWDLLNAVRDRYGFTVIPQPSNASLYNTPTQWAEWLKSFGALRWCSPVFAASSVIPRRCR